MNLRGFSSSNERSIAASKLIDCPAILVAAPASGQGKTTLTAALARLHARQGRRVSVFKYGPDFLDPQIHAVASGRPCYNLDLRMGGEADARWRLAAAARESDLVVVEGVMGLFDGDPSAADLAGLFGIPILALIDAGGMAQTFGAIAHGLATYRPGLPFAGVLANRVGKARHAALLRASLPPGMRWFGAVPRCGEVFPARHLGLFQAAEIGDLTERLDRLADALAASTAEAAEAINLPPPVRFPEVSPPILPPRLAGRRIAVAHDSAYGFIYPANLDTLAGLGAKIHFFSPLAGDALPACDAVWLPGGYPELHAAALSARRDLWDALAAHVTADKPLLAECGGLMSLFERLVDGQGETHVLAGLLPGETAVQPRLAALGLQEAELPEGHLRGHSFHYSQSATPLAPLVHARRPDGSAGEAIYRVRRLTASYMHFYFPSNPLAVAGLFAVA